jgi:hypothetical protein
MLVYGHPLAKSTKNSDLTLSGQPKVSFSNKPGQRKIPKWWKVTMFVGCIEVLVPLVG